MPDREELEELRELATALGAQLMPMMVAEFDKRYVRREEVEDAVDAALADILAVEREQAEAAA